MKNVITIIKSLVRRVWLYWQGKKTYAIAFIMGALNLAVAFNLISPDHLIQINMVLGALGLGALRAGVNKSQQ